VRLQVRLMYGFRELDLGNNALDGGKPLPWYRFSQSSREMILSQCFRIIGR
jgi:hypothetical protein